MKVKLVGFVILMVLLFNGCGNPNSTMPMSAKVTVPDQDKSGDLYTIIGLVDNQDSYSGEKGEGIKLVVFNKHKGTWSTLSKIPYKMHLPYNMEGVHFYLGSNYDTNSSKFYLFNQLNNSLNEFDMVRSKLTKKTILQKKYKIVNPFTYVVYDEHKVDLYDFESNKTTYLYTLPPVQEVANSLGIIYDKQDQLSCLPLYYTRDSWNQKSHQCQIIDKNKSPKRVKIDNGFFDNIKLEKNQDSWSISLLIEKRHNLFLAYYLNEDEKNLSRYDDVRAYGKSFLDKNGNLLFFEYIWHSYNNSPDTMIFKYYKKENPNISVSTQQIEWKWK